MKFSIKKLLWAIGFGLISVLLYLLVGSQYMRFLASRAGVPDPSTPYEETVQGRGQCTPITITVLGDSTAIGTGASARDKTFSRQTIAELFLKDYTAIKYINRAKGGAVVSDIVNSQLNDAIKDKPAFVFIAVGANDVTGFTSTATYQAQFNQMLDKLVKQTDAKIILLGVPAVYSAPVLIPLFPSLLDFFTRRLIEVQDQSLPNYNSSRVFKVDIYNTTGALFAAHPEYFAADGYHPNDIGYNIWASEINKVVRPLLEKNPC